MPKLESITLISIFLRDYLPRDKDANSVSSPMIAFSLSMGDSLQKELDLLFEYCTVVDKLVIYLCSWLELKLRLVLPPVSYLGLHSKAVEGPHFHYQALVSALVTLTAPKLRTVRLLHACVEESRESIPSFAAEDRSCLVSRFLVRRFQRSCTAFLKELPPWVGSVWAGWGIIRFYHTCVCSTDQWNW
ncbi:hypothetical protein J3R82DRAFT_9045 [Butyriboletus roseoflavus]|nr:hypothetical protein J3R82DRAFT_9045 [Butyriboletus roseoflavus]